MARASARSTNFDRVLKLMMGPPEIRTEPGFAAHVKVPPGEMYDPLFMREHEGTVWINDDGGQESERGRQGHIWAVDRRGHVSVVVAPSRLWGPPVSFDIAPASFTPYEGQIFTISQPAAGAEAVMQGHFVERVDPRTLREAERFCALPPTGNIGGGVPAGGMDARFGPEGGPFAGKFFVVAWANGTVYQVTRDRQCFPFVTFDQQKWGLPIGLAFSPDNQHLLVSMSQNTPGTAAIARVRPDGAIEPEQLVRAAPNKILSLWAMAYAPAGFGRYGGQLFVAATTEQWVTQHRYRNNEVPKSGELYRLTAEGDLKLVASGFRISTGVLFVGNRLWVSDVNGDFQMLAMRELPDGFIVEITPTRE